MLESLNSERRITLITWRKLIGKATTVIHSIILATTPSLFVYPDASIPWTGFYELKIQKWKLQRNFREKERYHLVSYDDILKLFEEIESGQAEEKYREKDLERINEYLIHLAKKGLPANSAFSLALEADIEDLLYGDTESYEYAFAVDDNEGYLITPAVCYEQAEILLCKNKLSKRWKKTKKFIKNHKKEIIIGAVIVVATAAIVITIVAVSGAGAAASAAGAAGAAASGHGKSKSDPQKQEPTASAHVDVDYAEAPIFKAKLDNQIDSFKDKLFTEEFFHNPSFSSQDEGLSWEETGRVLGPIFAHQSVSEFQNRLLNDPELAYEIQNVRRENHLPLEDCSTSQSFNRQEIESAFSSDSFFANDGKVGDFNALSYHMLGEQALQLGYYNQAVRDLGKAIELDPFNNLPYLERSFSFFHLGDYDRSQEDFQAFTSQAPTHPLSVSEFSLGFARGLPKGVYESGEGILLFLADFVSHPIHTSTQIFEALSTLARLAKNDKWGVIGESLSPEIHQLVTEWDSLPSDIRGELAGYALGKHGADILVPGALVKVASKSVKSAKELAAICKNIKIANEILVLETAAGIGSTVKIGELVQGGQRTARVAENLGFSSREMGKLKLAGNLESTVANTVDHIAQNPALRESFELFNKAQEFLKPYREFMPEKVCRELINKTGVDTFPRPLGIPKNFRVKVSDRGAGMIYFHPEHAHTSIRVMPGKPYSPWAHQQKPYVVQTKNGRILDKSGNIVSRDAPEAHIPIEEFVFIGD